MIKSIIYFVILFYIVLSYSIIFILVFLTTKVLNKCLISCKTLKLYHKIKTYYYHCCSSSSTGIGVVGLPLFDLPPKRSPTPENHLDNFRRISLLSSPYFSWMEAEKKKFIHKIFPISFLKPTILLLTYNLNIRKLW